MSQETTPQKRWAPWPVWLLVAVIVLGGGYLFAGGIKLATLGGSWYFVVTGAALLVTAWLTARRQSAALWLFAAILLGTVIWAVWEVGFAFWPLVSRLVAPAVLGILMLLAAPTLDRGGRRLGWRPALGGVAVLVVALAATGWRAFQPTPIIAPHGTPGTAGTVANDSADWSYYGRNARGTRYVPNTQITRDNVADLELAWTYRHGDTPAASAGIGAEDQNTPMQIGNTVYACTVHDQIHALDADTGEARWVFDPEAASPLWERCRGLGYYESDGTVSESLRALIASGDVPARTPVDAPEGLCARRVVQTTIDARLIEIDAETGEYCPQFGDNGTVSLGADMGDIRPGFYFQTSAPLVAGDVIVVGGWVVDNVMVGEPSGVVRAFDAETGTLVWAWDLGNPDITRLPPEGETYTRGTPNVWSTMAYDAELGLVYLPTGNATPDFYGGHRRDFDEEYTASIVALDATTGRHRWHFRTVHHDLWDYDVPAQPALYDIPDGNGGTLPALIQTTKRGQIFVLNRETGEPIFDVEERPVPQGAAEGDWTAETQPYSVGMPAIGVEPLTEARMWGMTPFDQLYCRIAFRELRYDGDFTPPGLDASLQWPGYYGGMNWGSSAIDEQSGYLIFNDTRSPHRVQLVSREVTDSSDARGSHDGLSTQYGTPYGAAKVTFASPLGIPCQEPPYGTLTAIDLTTQEIAWQVPLGTTAENGPLGIRMGAPIPVGMPTVGGPVVTETGLIFYAGTLDYTIRAFDLATGEEVWSHPLPVGSQATPLVYTSPETGREYVVISAGGARTSTNRGDYVMAFALPQ